MKKELLNHLKAWGVLIGSILIVLTFMSSYSYGALVGYWKFDENTGNTVYDTSGSNNTGTIYGATWTSGKCRSGLSFGGNSYVLVPNSSSIDLGVWTVSCWVSFANLDVAQVILDKRNGYHHRNYSLAYYPNESPLGGPFGDYLTALIGSGSCPSTYDCGTYQMVNFNQNQLYHIAATYDGSILKLYLDGTLLASRTMNMTGITGTGALSIGDSGGADLSACMYGTIDEVKIYNHVLSEAEILAEFQQPCPPVPVVSGCIELKGAPAPDGVEVQLKQKKQDTQTTNTDEHGCYQFDNVVKGKSFDITIKGLVVNEP